MGKFFLIAIVAGLAYGAYGIYGHIYGLTHPEPVKLEAVQPARARSVDAEGEDSGQTKKPPPAPSSSEKKEPLRVLASNHEWIHVEAWAIVGPGDPLPDGSRLESWDKWEAVIVTETGERGRWRFRTVGEALAELVPAMAAATGVPISND